MPAPGTPRILTVGRLVPKKGHDVLIAAAAALREQDTAFQLRIAGDGPEWPRLQRLVHELELGDRVIFLGPLTPAEATALPEVLPVAHVEFALSEVEYFADVTGSAANAELAYDGYLLGHARWFAAPAGAEVLDHLRRRSGRGPD